MTSTRNHLHELMATSIPWIVDRFVNQSRAHTLPARNLTREEIIDSLTEYLTELVSAMRASPLCPTNPFDTALVHGRQRWDKGYDLKTLVLEYGILRECILTEVERLNEPIDVREFNGLVRLLMSGIADAASDFARKSTEQLSVNLEEARTATDARENVLAVVAHDLKAPLHIIMGSTSLIRDDIKEGRVDQIDESARRIDRAARKMSLLVSDLLNLARLTSGELALQPREHLAGELLRDAREQMLPLAEPKAITISTQASKGMVRCDRERVLQVLENLLSNAIKFSPAGGHIQLTAEESGEDWIFTVRDQGEGISAERIPYVFNRFWQGGKEASGTGLGLSIAKGLVELHGGSIGVDSGMGEGATFQFTIPLSGDSA